MTARDGAAPAAIRLDVWLDVACLFKTRSEAQRACRGGKVDVNGAVAKPHRVLHVGDEVRITRTAGRRQLVAVTELTDTHLRKADARRLYDDRTPPPTPQELAQRELERHFFTFRGAGGHRMPDRRERRRLRRVKEGEA